MEELASLRSCRERIEEMGIASLHGDTLEKQGISFDELLHPSARKDLKKIKSFDRVSFYLAVLEIYSPVILLSCLIQFLLSFIEDQQRH